MSGNILTKLDADKIIKSEKFITEEIKWIEDPNIENFYEFRVPIQVLNDPYTKLILKGSTNIVLNRHSFAIIYNGMARIKALDIGKEHLNKCPNHPKERIGIKHKHTWQYCCRDKWAYVPDDITDNAPLEQVFWEFLDECNIQYEGTFPKLPILQMEMIFDELLVD
jgi:hypothetical protein